jgi:Uma2 family endonuclease
MTTNTPVVKPISKIHLAPGSLVTITDVTWQEFESIFQELGNKRAARIAYSQSTLEIMVPLPEHEKPKEIISDIVKTLLRAKKVRYEPFGSTTFKREGVAAVEPDACFYIQNYQRMIGCRRLQPNDPPPDLAIEIDVTSKATLDAYIAIEVPELWIYDGTQLVVYLLQNQKYLKSATSPNFPEIDLSQIVSSTVERAWVVGNLQALEELELLLVNHPS